MDGKGREGTYNFFSRRLGGSYPSGAAHVDLAFEGEKPSHKWYRESGENTA